MTWPGPYPGPGPGESPEAAVTTPAKGTLTWPHQPTEAHQAESPLKDYHYEHTGVRWPQGDFKWLELVASLPADNIPFGALGGLVETGQLIIYGGSINNASTNAGVVTLRDGADGTGQPFCILNVPASTAVQLALPRAGILLEIGLFMSVAGGAYTGSLYVAHLWKYPFTPAGE